MITEFEQETSDYDWYFTDGDKIGYVTSSGGRLPHEISKSLENIELLADFFWELPPESGFIVNPLLRDIMGVKVTDIYLGRFIYLAERGVFTFDKTSANNFDDTNYYWVTKPATPISFSQLPKHICDILLKSKTINPDRDSLDVNVFDENL
jgi:hypothetical protein